MGKQTSKKNSTFGGEWTRQKLIIVEKYLNFYIEALKKQKFQKVYIDAFAGSGVTEISSGEILVGSALSSLQYDFDEYYFLDINEDNLTQLKEYAQQYFPTKINKVHFIPGDSNRELKKVLGRLTKYQRGVIFLDPYAMELEWGILKDIQKTGILDVWYLFPFAAANRNIYKNGKIPKANKNKLNKIFGDDTWESAFYKENPQMDLFGARNYDKANAEEMRNYIIVKMKEVFPYVSEKSNFLKNKTNSPLFLLCYAISNDSARALALGNKVVADIIESVENSENYET